MPFASTADDDPADGPILDAVERYRRAWKPWSDYISVINVAVAWCYLGPPGVALVNRRLEALGYSRAAANGTDLGRFTFAVGQFANGCPTRRPTPEDAP